MNEKTTMMQVLDELAPEILKGIQEDSKGVRVGLAGEFVDMIGKMAEAFFTNEVGETRSTMEMVAINAAAQVISRTINETQSEEDQLAAKSAAFIVCKRLHIVAITEAE